MRVLGILAAAALGLGLFGVAAQAATVGTVSGDFLADDGVLPPDGNHDFLITSISKNDAFLSSIRGDAVDGAGFYSFGFQATEALDAFEFSTINLPGNFEGASVAWTTNVDGTGIIASLNAAQILAGARLYTTFALNEIQYLFVQWTNVSANASNFDLRVSAVPIPGAAWLFGTALLGGGIVVGRRRRRRTAETAAV